MNNEHAPPPALIDRLIATLLAFFGVPLAFALAVLEACAAVKARFAQALRICRAEGWALRRDGENDATVAARVKFIAWIAEDPWAAGKYLARQLRGWEAHRHAHYVNVLFLPPRALGCALSRVCVFASPPPDTS